MLNESDGQQSIRHWKKNVNMYCPRCYRHSDHSFMQTSGTKTVVRKGHSGTAHYAQYKCETDDCGQLVEVEVFVKAPMKTVDMFPDDEIPF